ncbi:MAG: YmdB family metallophosphoesterase [Alphaproteobacteria bacterium]
MEAVDCPVQAMDRLLKSYTLGRNIDAIFVDVHAEATAEKNFVRTLS